MLCLPGIIALHMTDALGIEANDQVYPAMVRHVLPAWSLGLFAAVLVGSILSSFNSALNSASTLFCLEFYQGYMKPEAPPETVVRVGKGFGAALAVGAMVIAPLLAQMESIFEYLQKVNGLYSVPIITIFLVGVLTRKPGASAAKAAILVGGGAYSVFTFFPVEGLHWLHGYAISFAAGLIIMAVMSQVAPKTAEEIAESERTPEAPVDMTPWSGAKPASLAIVVMTIAMYGVLTVLAG
ncbi:MAG: solute:sodium symporter family transporter, partial [Myxococcota bacterium]|nr:solute:sodium symporter family transporter [Myxococcota bacterium]